MSVARGFIVLKIVGCLGVAAGLLVFDRGVATVCVAVAVAVAVGLVCEVFFTVPVFALVAVAAILGWVVKADLAAAVVLVIKYSCALKTFRQEPQRTAPLADCSWLGVTRKVVPHLGQRVINWLLAEVMVYLLLKQRRRLKTRWYSYQCFTV